MRSSLLVPPHVCVCVSHMLCYVCTRITWQVWGSVQVFAGKRLWRRRRGEYDSIEMKKSTEDTCASVRSSFLNGCWQLGKCTDDGRNMHALSAHTRTFASFGLRNEDDKFSQSCYMIHSKRTSANTSTNLALTQPSKHDDDVATFNFAEKHTLAKPIRHSELVSVFAFAFIPLRLAGLENWWREESGNGRRMEWRRSNPLRWEGEWLSEKNVQFVEHFFWSRNERGS